MRFLALTFAISCVLTAPEANAQKLKAGAFIETFGEGAADAEERREVVDAPYALMPPAFATGCRLASALGRLPTRSNQPAMFFSDGSRAWPTPARKSRPQ